MRHYIANWLTPVCQLAAEESVIQMVNYASWLDLRSFLKDRDRNKDPTKVISIPAFYRTILDNKDDRPLLYQVMIWVEKRTAGVLQKLMIEAPLQQGDPLFPSGDWKKVSNSLPRRCFKLYREPD